MNQEEYLAFVQAAAQRHKESSNGEPEEMPRRIGLCPVDELPLLGEHIRAAREEAAKIVEKPVPSCSACKQPMYGGHSGFPWTCFRGCEPVKQEKPQDCGVYCDELAEQVRGQVGSWIALRMNQGFSAHGAEDNLSKHIESQFGIDKSIHNGGTIALYMRELRAQCQILKDAFGT